MSEEPNEFARRLHQFRTEAGLSLGQLAEKAGVSKGYLWNLENQDEEKRPSAKMLFAIANALGVTLADLLGREVTATISVTIEPSLKRFAEEYGLPQADVDMLASVQWRGDPPRSIERWRYIYNAIRTSRALDDDQGPE